MAMWKIGRTLDEALQKEPHLIGWDRIDKYTLGWMCISLTPLCSNVWVQVPPPSDLEDEMYDQLAEVEEMMRWANAY